MIYGKLLISKREGKGFPAFMRSIIAGLLMMGFAPLTADAFTMSAGTLAFSPAVFGEVLPGYAVAAGWVLPGNDMDVNLLWEEAWGGGGAVRLQTLGLRVSRSVSTDARAGCGLGVMRVITGGTLAGTIPVFEIRGQVIVKKLATASLALAPAVRFIDSGGGYLIAPQVALVATR